MKKSIKAVSVISAAVIASLCFTGCGKKQAKSDLSAAQIAKLDQLHEGYKLVWQDEFNGKKLDDKKWSFETHEPGWVNNELQEYVISDKNVYVKDGHLVIQPVKTEDSAGNVSYTSGRINTKGKADFKYGIFEAKLKVPLGQGYLPAFWMMPTNEEKYYGAWPMCGEIDIMEVLGNEPNKLYGTLHFGQPHTMKQVTTTSPAGRDYASTEHVFSLVWEPDEMRFYVDGFLYGKVNDWFTKQGKDDPITFPAPYDQPFYMILNVAVGGDWPGYPDEGTPFNEYGAMKVDYVRVYQKDSYNEDVKQKEEKYDLREAVNGNFVNNGDFSVEENLYDNKDWKYMQQMGGSAKVEISGGKIAIVPENTGDVDYSIQLVQAGIPMERGSLYEFSFDAYSTEPRNMMAKLCSTKTWVSYTEIDTQMTSKKQTFTSTFQMTEPTDPNARLDFNMGATKSKAPVYITNVKLKKLEKGSVELPKSMTSEGNYVYNGTFDRGDGRMQYWTVDAAEGNKFEVTNENNIRKAKVTVAKAGDNAVVLSQNRIPLLSGNTYLLSLEADAGIENADVYINDTNLELVTPSSKEKPYKCVFEAPKVKGTSVLKFVFSKEGTVVFDNVKLTENSLIMNRNFDNEMSGWELYSFNRSDSEIDASAGYAKVTVNDTTDIDWKIQLKQSNIVLEKDVTYKFSFDVWSTMNRDIRYALQRDGARWKTLYGVEDWIPYNDAPTCSIGPAKTRVEQEFTMSKEDDSHVILTFSMGTIDGNRISKTHDIFFDNIELVPVE